MGTKNQKKKKMAVLESVRQGRLEKWSLPPLLMKNSIAFGKSTSQRIYTEQNVPKIGWKLHKYGLKHALHTLDGHFR